MRNIVRSLALTSLALGLAACAPPRSALDGDWVVQTIAGAPLAAEEEVYLSIDVEEQTLRGHTGCNAFSADVRLFERALTISNVREQDAPCPSEPARINEARLLGVLPAIARYARHGQALELLAREAQPDALLQLRADNFATPARTDPAL